MKAAHLIVLVCVSGCIGDSARPGADTQLATETDAPPATETDAPPAIETDVPPAVETDVPPAVETDVPPVTATDAPPATGADTQPAPDTTFDAGPDAEVDAREDAGAPVEVVDVGLPELACLAPGCAAPSSDCVLEPGYCFIAGSCVADGTVMPGAPCHACRASDNPLSWIMRPDGSDCDDGVGCTGDDTCMGGLCRGESTCPSRASCLTATCNAATDMCMDTIDSGRCFIDGVCFGSGQIADDRCGGCRPDESQTAWTAGDGNEPDEQLDFANPLGFNDLRVSSALDTDPGWNGPWESSSLSPVTDLDAFGYVYVNEAGAARPTMKVTSVSAVALETCLYLRCLPTREDSERPLSTVTCSEGDSKKSEGDWVGCCRVQEGSAQEHTLSGAWCEEAGDRVTAYVEVGVTVRRRLPAVEPECVPYALRWGVR